MADANFTAAQQATNPTQPTGVNWGPDEVGFVIGFISNSLMELSLDGLTLSGGDSIGLGLILKSCESALKEAA